MSILIGTRINVMNIIQVHHHCPYLWHKKLIGGNIITSSLLHYVPRTHKSTPWLTCFLSRVLILFNHCFTDLSLSAITLKIWLTVDTAPSPWWPSVMDRSSQNGLSYVHIYLPPFVDSNYELALLKPIILSFWVVS